MLCLWSLVVLACALCVVSGQPQAEDCQEYVDYVSQDNAGWDCVSHGDCTGMQCDIYALRPDRDFLGVASFTMEMCASPPLVHVFFDSPATGIRNFSTIFYKPFEQQSVVPGELSIHLNNSLVARISRTATHMDLWVNLVYVFSHSNTLFDMPNVPLLPGYCMCRSLQQVASDIRGPPVFMFEPSCAVIENDSVCSGITCSYADFIAEMIVDSCEDELQFTVYNSSGAEVYQVFSNFEFDIINMVEFNGTSGYIRISNYGNDPDQVYAFTIGASYWYYPSQTRIEYVVLPYGNHSVILDKRCPVTPSTPPLELNTTNAITTATPTTEIYTLWLSENAGTITMLSSFEMSSNLGDFPTPTAGSGELSTPTAGSRDLSTPTAGSGDLSTPTAGSGDLSTPTAGSGDLSTPTAGSGDLSTPTAGSGDLSTPTAGSGDLSTPTADSGDLSTPTAGSGDLSTPTAGSGDLSTPTAGSGDLSTPTAGSGDLSTPTAGSGDLLTPTAGSGVLSTPTAGSGDLSTPTAGAGVLSTPTAGSGDLSTPTAGAGVLSTPTAGSGDLPTPTASLSTLTAGPGMPSSATSLILRSSVETLSPATSILSVGTPSLTKGNQVSSTDVTSHSSSSVSQGLSSSLPAPSMSSVSEQPPTQETSGKSRGLGLKVGVPIGVFLLVLLAVVIAVVTIRCFRKQRKRNKGYSFQRIVMNDL